MKIVLGIALGLSLGCVSLGATPATAPKALPQIITQLASSTHANYSACCSDGGWECGVAPDNVVTCCYPNGKETRSACPSN
jgi:hypothetical protein